MIHHSGFMTQPLKMMKYVRVVPLIADIIGPIICVNHFQQQNAFGENKETSRKMITPSN